MVNADAGLDGSETNPQISPSAQPELDSTSPDLSPSERLKRCKRNRVDATRAHLAVTYDTPLSDLDDGTKYELNLCKHKRKSEHLDNLRARINGLEELIGHLESEVEGELRESCGVAA
ncbi:hypothetical protein HYFRA_00006387 [Hymenoscyphus fraxineus]|uniref:Uncharacterized protein n=1 Tax=Hymenoscyphus fraxineus TaxID=746836 RepID=A0A9N9PPF5_9HELO|nr:hypothetical protein HYFRA_00006387 [Hymenoscyphus fraxineus]